MKTNLKFYFFAFAFILSGYLGQAKPLNLYEQLCEVNQEWKKYKYLAEAQGFTQMPVIENEQKLLQFHLSFVEKLFREKVTSLTPAQVTERLHQLDVLNHYWKYETCPSNYYKSTRIPVFIDDENHYCAVAYLMLNSGKKDFTEAVRQNSNHIYIREIENEEFSAWQKASGLSIDELAWIQPGYMPVVKIAYFNKSGSDGQPTFLAKKDVKRIYDYDNDNTDMFRFDRIFFGVPWDIAKEFPKLKYKGEAPAWEQLPGRIIVAQVYKNQIYASADSSLSVTDESGETIYSSLHTLYKWTGKSWEALNVGNGKNMICSLWEYKGKLYAGGGNYNYDASTQQSWENSFLSIYDGKEWNEVKQEFGGHVFGLIYKNKQIYIGSVYNGLDEMMQEELKKEQEMQSTEAESENQNK